MKKRVLKYIIANSEFMIFLFSESTTVEVDSKITDYKTVQGALIGKLY